MELAPFIHDLAVILAAAAAVALVFQHLRLPVILGYILVGMAVGPRSLFQPAITDTEGIRVWGELGVVFLMFTLGLDFSFRRLMAVGLRSAFAGFFEISAMLLAGFWLGRWLGLSTLQSFFLAGTVAISSTTILVTSMRNLGLNRRRFADTVFGILIIEDLIAVLILVALSSFFTRGEIEGMGLVLLLGQLVLVVCTWMLVGFLVVPRILRWTERMGSDELLMILSLGLCLGLVAVGTRFGYSPALGAFIMGSIIGETRNARHIENLVKPLRDLFAAVFFVSVGMLINPLWVIESWTTVVLIATLVIFGKFTFVGLGALLSGHPARHSIQAGMAMTQIGEFSFLIAGLGSRLGATDERFFSLIVGVSVATTFFTPLLMRSAGGAAHLYERHAPERWRLFWEKYHLWLQGGEGLRRARTALGGPLMRLTANGILITAAFVMAGNYLLPMMNQHIASTRIAAAAAWVVTFALTAPFVWAMLSATRTLPARAAGLMYINRLVTLVWIGLVSLNLLSAWTALLGTTAAIGILTLMFRPRLQASYDWLEDKFLATFKETDGDGRGQRMQALKKLAPWDAHLAQLTVDADSEVAGKTLSEARLRERFGLNILALQRGSRLIVAPPRNERLFPDDEILVLAMGDLADHVHAVIEGTGRRNLPSHDLSDFDLHTLLLDESSSLCGKTIFASELRERYGALVVGVEREGRRIMNPPSQLELKPGDRLWVVGDRNRVREI